jgi:hypothetical protein
MNDEVGKRAVPGSVFRFGRTSMDGKHPIVEIKQPGWAVGTRYFVPFKDEGEVRDFLIDLGFIEQPRANADTPRWK